MRPSDRQRHLRRRPRHGALFEGLGTIYKKEQHAQAIADYDKAIQLRANLSTAYNDRGIAYQALGNFDAALRDFTESGTEPNALGYENRAYIHLRRIVLTKQFR